MISVKRCLYNIHSNSRSISTTGIQNKSRKKYSKDISSKNLRGDRRLNPSAVKIEITDYRDKNAFRLIKLNEKYKFIKTGQVVVEYGASPGSWTQYVVKSVLSDKTNGLVIATDKANFYPIAGATALPCCDIKDSNTVNKIVDLLKGRKVDVILSDMIPNMIGISSADCMKMVELLIIILEFAIKYSNENGSLLFNIYNHSCSKELLEEVKKYYGYHKVIDLSTRQETNKIYLFASKFKIPLLK